MTLSNSGFIPATLPGNGHLRTAKFTAAQARGSAGARLGHRGERIRLAEVTDHPHGPSPRLARLPSGHRQASPSLAPCTRATAIR